MATYTTNRNLTNLFDPFFKDLFEVNLNSESFGNSFMLTDIKENEKEIELSVDLPGFKKEDINISFADGYLTVEAKTSRKIDEKDSHKWIKRERFSGKTSRSYYVGDINEANIRASYENGELKVIVPKEYKEEKIHQITID